jgi:oligoribonuclease (3'-5' exoribonuclease)
VPGRAFIEHGVIHIHQAVNIVLGEHIGQAQRFINRHRIGLQNLFCLIIIQISAITTNCRCIQSQCLIKRMDSDVMSAGDDDHLNPASGAGQRFQRSGQDSFVGGEQGAV